MIDLIIGIDPGVSTGFAIWIPQNKIFHLVKTLKIHKAMQQIIELSNNYNVYVIVEDARLRKWFGSNSNLKQQGAGSIKRDSKIWDDFLNDLKKLKAIVDYKMIHPIKGATKLNKTTFARATKYNESTSEHGRDAAMLVFQKDKSIFKF